MNLTKFRSLLFAGILLCCPVLLFSHSSPSTTSTATFHRICGKSNLSTSNSGNCPAESIPANFNTCGDGYVTISTYTTNLVKKPQYGINYPWPSNYPDMHLSWEYQPGQTNTTTKLDIWKYIGTHHSGHAIFECQKNLIPKYLENFECNSAFFTFEMPLELVTPSSSGYITYPIISYAASDDIFSCQVFEETCALCNPPGGSGQCQLTLSPFYNFEICADCEANYCYDQDQAPSDHIGQTQKIVSTQVQLEVVPNPFSTNVSISYSTSLESAVKVSIYNANGQKIRSEEKFAGVGNNSFELNTEQLSNGIYYLEISDGVNINVERLVKIQ